MIPVCWRTTGPDCMAVAGWHGRRSMQAGPGVCQLTGQTCSLRRRFGRMPEPDEGRSEAVRPKCRSGLAKRLASVRLPPVKRSCPASRRILCAAPAGDPSAISSNRNAVEVRAARGAKRRVCCEVRSTEHGPENPASEAGRGCQPTFPQAGKPVPLCQSLRVGARSVWSGTEAAEQASWL